MLPKLFKMSIKEYICFQRLWVLLFEKHLTTFWEENPKKFRRHLPKYVAFVWKQYNMQYSIQFSTSKNIRWFNKFLAFSPDVKIWGNEICCTKKKKIKGIFYGLLGLRQNIILSKQMSKPPIYMKECCCHSRYKRMKKPWAQWFGYTFQA